MNYCNCGVDRCPDNQYQSGYCIKPWKRSPYPSAVQIVQGFKTLDTSKNPTLEETMIRLVNRGKYMPTVTVTTTQEVKISPSIRKKLLTELKVYAEIVGQIKVLESAKDKHKEAIGAIREETGEQKLEIDGYSVTLVAPIRKKFSPKKFVSLGGDLAIYNQAVEDVTSRSYEKISIPGTPQEDGE